MPTELYKKCTLRVSGKVHEGHALVGFNMENGEVIRLRIPVGSVKQIYRSIDRTGRKS